MPHTNSQSARDRKASRSGRKPAFLQKKAKSTASKTATDAKADALGTNTATTSAAEQAATPDPSIPKGRQDQTTLIRRFHAIEKQLASPALTDPDERKKLEREREQLGGLETYQAASQHGGDKTRGGESSKWLVKQIKDLKIGLPAPKYPADDATPPKKVEPKILEDGTKVWPKVERRKLRLLDVGAIAGTAYAGYPWISTTSIDLNPLSDSVLRYNFFDFPVPTEEEEKYDIVALSLVMNYEGSLVNRGHMLLRAHDYLLPHGYLYLVLPLPCLTNSRYLSHARLTSLLTSTGWTVERQHDSAKLTYWLLRRSGERGEGEERDGKEWKREVVRKGAQRNNFCVLVQPGKPVVRAGAAEGEKAGAKSGGVGEEEGDGTAIESMERDDDDDDE
ncbi:hypothetical protein C6P46_005895 [Rhodotorula mucilaginosa]|uniref:25S rRNA adenine-N(1) methyltransferase n=1 Tax=Rhodotorula mucilaginosa TaxID=5537 RepID=A0A9P6VZL0_RHOMI|nr:hypothetical protein C6P46_005895 [Rhodotorula mucilaginosa]